MQLAKDRFRGLGGTILNNTIETCKEIPPLRDWSMELLREKIIKCLNQFADDEDRLISELDQLIMSEGRQTYSVIFHVLTSLVLGTKEAEESWHEIVAHCARMSEAMGRKVSLRTAICDYFCSVNKSLRNPKVVEINIFEKAAKSSQMDSLTGLYNRRFFDGMLVRELARSKRHNTQLSILFLDLDDFKEVNDTFGHIAGDKVLKRVANIIMNEKRTEDLAARYGGEELVIISPETNKANTLILGERIRRKVEKMNLKYEGQNISITTSGGLASFPIDATDPLTLLKYADQALYRAKTTGKNNISLFSEDKRNFIRVDFSSKITASKIASQGDDKEYRGTGKNISEGGILFKSPHPMEIDAEVQLDINLDNGSRIDLTGNVVRIEAFGADEYEIGLSFVKMKTNTRTELTSYISRQLERFPPNS